MYSNMTTEVVVLMGGRSSERDVSIMSGVAVSESLRDNGYNVTKIDFQNGDLLLEQLVKKSPDVIFNALHGRHGEDGCVQGLLNILGIPYTHSGVTASAIAMDKHMTKKVLDTSNILFPDHQILTRDDLSSKLSIEVPFVIKPITEGSSVGGHIIRVSYSISEAIEDAAKYDDIILIEEFIEGKELTVGILNGEALPIVHIQPLSGFYDMKNKYPWLDGGEGSEYFCPADLDEESTRCVQELAIEAHKALGVEIYSRVDVILSEDGTLQTVVFKKDLDKHLRHPNESIDEQKRLLVGAAISTHAEDRERAQELIANGVDLLFIDASDGHTEYQGEMINFIKKHSNTPVVGGNIVTSEGFRFLVDSGADAVKVGMGIGSGCTTQEVKATGRGQGTSLMEVGKSRQNFSKESGRYIPLIADGGISGTADMSVSLALGADTLMMGNFFARYTESHGSLMRNASGEIVKEYWMEGSMRAHNMRRYAQTKENFFEEGISGYVPHVGSIFDKLPIIIQMLRSTLATTGCKTIEELHTNAVLERQSPSALLDSKIHDIVPMNIDQQVL